jgi:hypothetical protein
VRFGLPRRLYTAEDGVQVIADHRAWSWIETTPWFLKPSRVLDQMKKPAFSLAFALSTGAILGIGATAVAQTHGDHLSMASARRSARATAWDVARRNRAVNSVKLSSCSRRAVDRVDCLALDRGSTSTLKTTCSVRVSVRAVGGRPKALLDHVSCENQRLALLRNTEAREAILALGREIAGQEVVLASVARTSRVEFAGNVAWTPGSASLGPRELCVVYLRAALVGEDVQVQASDSPRCASPR